jgi:hypothetical protein
MAHLLTRFILFGESCARADSRSIEPNPTHRFGRPESQSSHLVDRAISLVDSPPGTAQAPRATRTENDVELLVRRQEVTADAARAPLQFGSGEDEPSRLVQQFAEAFEFAFLLLESVLSLATQSFGFGQAGESLVAFGRECVRFERADLRLESGDLRRIAFEHHRVGDQLLMRGGRSKSAWRGFAM